MNIEVTTILSITAIASAIAYRTQFFHKKKLGYISLLQVIYLLVIPAVTYTLVFSEVLDILKRPVSPYVFIPDKLLVTILFLSLVYTYGALAIHTLTKTLSRYFSYIEKRSVAFEVNEYFHLNFSHNLIYGGALVSFFTFAMLETNHVSPYGPDNGISMAILNGLFVGLSGIASFYFYEKKSWWDLKYVFMVFWIIFVLTMYSVREYFDVIRQYPLMLTSLIAFCMIAIMNLFIYTKKAKSHLRIIINLPKLLSVFFKQ
jgi:hypothetical protein